GVGIGEALLELGDLPLPDVGSLRRARAMLHDASDRLDAGRPRQLLDLGELLVGIQPLTQDREDEPALRLLGTWNHQTALCPPSPGHVEQSTAITPAASPDQALAERTRALVDIPSVSRGEEQLYLYVKQNVGLPLVHDDGESLVYARRSGRPLVLLSGHMDTVPIDRNVPGRIEGGAVPGRGAGDLKSGLAGMSGRAP